MVSKNTFGIIFFTRKYKSEEKKKLPIYAKITVDGSVTEISVKLDVLPNNWNERKGAAKGHSEEVKTLNTLLEQIRGRITESYQEIKLQKKLVTATSVKNKYIGIEEDQHSLLGLFDYHNQEMKSTLEWGTLKNYYTTKKYVELYLKKSLKTSDISLLQLSYKFLVGFEKFIRDYQPLDYHKPCGNNATMKHIERLRKVINLAIKNEWLERDPFMKFKPTFTKSNREYLTEEELSAIEKKEYSIPRLQQVKDLFIFSCYTGLAYIDSFNLTPKNLSLGIDGQTWLITSRKKTDVPVKVPLLPTALAIIEKYKNDPAVLVKGKLLPTFSNQKLNSYLKEIADFCGITKNLTFHLARHTFATTVTLTNGVPIETVSKMLGHTSIKTTQIYAKVIEKKVGNDMQILRMKLSEKTQVKSEII